MSLMQPILRQWNRITGGGSEFSVTVPVMDGPLKPNDAIERTALVASMPRAGTLVRRGETLLFSRGREVLELQAAGGVATLATVEGEISALAVASDGSLAIGVAGQGVVIDAPDGSRRVVEGAGLACVTALCFLPDGALAIANGSLDVAPGDWAHDLLGHGQSGSVALVGPGATEARVLVDGLRFPSGLCAVAGAPDRLAVCEAWAHRIVEVSVPERRVAGVLSEQLPCYPARLSPRAGGGYVVASYSVRSQLIEFVLRERRFLRRMREEVAPEFWIAPSLRSGDSFKEPLQAGGVIRLGIHKPWAPTRSYGLMIGLSPSFQPVWSAHSRADGKRHGVTSVTEWGEGLAALSQGNGDLFLLDGAGRPIAASTATEGRA